MSKNGNIRMKWRKKVFVVLITILFIFPLIRIFSQNTEFSSVEDRCFNESNISFLVLKKIGETSTSIGPHPSHRTNWEKAILYQLTYELNIQPSPIEPKIKKLREILDFKEGQHSYSFSEENIACQLGDKNKESSYDDWMYFSNPKYAESGFTNPSKPIGKFNDSIEVCYSRNGTRQSNKIEINCPESSFYNSIDILSDEQSETTSAFTILDKAGQQIIILDKSYTGTELPWSKQLRIWNYRTNSVKTFEFERASFHDFFD